MSERIILHYVPGYSGRADRIQIEGRLMEKISDIVSFRNCLLLSDERIVVLAGYDEADEEDAPHTVLISAQGLNPDFDVQEIDFTASHIASLNTESDCYIVMDKYGRYYVNENGGNHEGNIFKEFTLPGEGRPIRRLRRIFDHLYCVGMSDFIYKGTMDLNWTEIGSGIKGDGSIEAVDGFSEDELYAVGWDGVIWCYDGSTWKKVASPTNVILTDIKCASDGYAYCTGRSGLVIKGRYDEWEVVIDLEEMEDLWSLQEFDNSIYLSGISGVFRFKEETLEELDIDSTLSEGITSYILFRSSDSLISMGNKDILQFDGHAWVRLF